MLIARYPPTIGGAEIQCQRLAGELVRKGHRVTVLTEPGRFNVPREELVDGVRVLRFRTYGPPPWSSCLYAIQVFAFLARHRRDFDILHAHMIAMPAMAALIAGKWFGIPVLTKVAGARRTGDLGTSQSLARGRLKLVLFRALAKYVVCPSPETRREFMSSGPVPFKLFEIPNGVDVNDFRPPSREEKIAHRAVVHWSQDELLALYVGRWAPGKGVEALLEVWEAARNVQGFLWKLILVLSEEPPPGLMKRVHYLGNAVRLTVRAQDPRPFYRASDLAILLSAGEGVSNFLLEAMASGLPALTTPAAAIPNSHGEADGNMVMPPGTTAAQIAELLTRWQHTPGALVELGGRARQMILTRYTLAQVASSYEQVYRVLR